MSTEPTAAELERTLQILNDATQSGKDFVWEQAPLVAKEVVYWTIGRNSLYGIFWIAIFVTLLFIGRWAHRKVVEWWPDIDGWDEGEKKFFLGMGYVVSFSIAFGVLLGILVCAEEVVKASVAPRITIIDYVSSRIQRGQ